MSVSHGIKTLGIIGAGQMGTLYWLLAQIVSEKLSFFDIVGLGIAYVAALRAKVPVKLYDRSSEQISKGLNLMDKLLAKDVAKGKIQEGDAHQARDRVSVVDQDLGVRALRDVDMVIEVRPEFQASQLAEQTISRLSRRTLKLSNAYSQN
jgi:3-hydroxybutyryl-CoA dehydrogenase